MRRFALVGIVPALFLSATVALAASPSGPKPGWEARSGVFKTNAAATAQLAALTAKGFTGYVIEVETRPAPSKARLYEVEKEFTTKKLAAAEVAHLHKAKFVGAVEYSPAAR